MKYHHNISSTRCFSMHPSFVSTFLFGSLGLSSKEILAYVTSSHHIIRMEYYFIPNVSPNAHFQKDLGLDNFDTVEIVMALEEEFGFEIPDNEADKIHSINLAVDFIASHP
ncbi:hypothetical protein ACS0TY_031499 [Phlomoides rotata]